MTAPLAVDSVRCAASLSTLSDSRQAAREACQAAIEQLGAPAHLALMFVSPSHADQLDALANLVCDAIGGEQLLSCTGESIVGGDREIEGRPAVSLWLARLPGASIDLMHLRYERSQEGGAIVGWPDGWPGEAAASALLVLGEPHSFPADLLLEQLHEDRPELVVTGGMASGAGRPGANRLAIGRRVVDEGAVVAALRGPFRMRTVVSQGCRPIGRPYVITSAERNVIFELGGRPALNQLQMLFRELPTREQKLVQKGLHVGRVVSEYKDHFEQGDFLVRNVVAIDQQTGAIAIGDLVRPGQTVQFHVRDAETADHELRQLLAQARDNHDYLAAGPLAYERASGGAKAPFGPPAGGLLFTCNGRGTRMFPAGDHDAGAIRAVLGEIPLAGFFAAGEIGPIGGQNFLHGFTASIALFEPALETLPG